MLTKFIFTAIVVAVILQRLIELGISKRNAAQILARGGREHGSNSLGLVKVLQVSWWIAAVTEVWLLDRPFMPLLAIVALLFTLWGQVLRYLSIRSLGKQWTLPIMTIPNTKAVNSGIYRYLRHPNWLGVILEIGALPLIHTAYLTAVLFTLANAWLMSKRIRAEEKALIEDTNYASVFANKRRFIPHWKFLSTS